MANNSSIPDFLPCGYNWTGDVMGETALLSTHSQLAGYIACAIACLFFGSNFVPFKFVKTGDGMFCQWVMCSAIFLTGIAMQLIREQPIFFPENLLGGTIWTIGNCCVVPVINLIGLSIGMLIWNCTNVLVGWATGRFGLFGVCDEAPANEAFNYSGVALCVLAGVVYIFVKTETAMNLPRCLRRNKNEEEITSYTPPQIGSMSQPGDDTHFNAGSSTMGQQLIPPEDKPVENIFLPKLPPFGRRILGVSLALASGCCYGVQFLPSVYIQDHYVVKGVRVSQDGLDYVFAQYTGIYLASTVFFACYVIINRKNSYIDVSIILPSMFSGIIWGIATCCFFLANSTLSPAITFPIIATVPGMIGALWGIFLFGEIRGLRNYLVLGLAFSLTICGAILTALSK